jgi:succinate dehydrogenase/fumarate reductase cytochrome b subunit
MLIILNYLGLKERNFRDFKDFEAVFHQIFTESRYLGFTKSGALTVIFVHALNALRHLDSRFLLGLFCHALLYYARPPTFYELI